MAETEVTISSFECLHSLAPLETPAETLQDLLNACLSHVSSSAAMADDSGFEILGALNCSATCACVCSCEPTPQSLPLHGQHNMSPFDLLFKKKRHPLLGRRQGEQGWLEDGARLLKEVISSCDGRGCYPIRMFSAKEIEQAIGQRFHEEAFFVEYEGNHEGRQIIIKVKQAMACMELAVRCKTNNRDERPAMKEVAQQLEQIERGELTLSSSLLRVQQLATVGSSEGVSQIRTQYESESISSEEVSPP
ncbi:hypothetical protein MRB53_001749 [Persea americana]|uniref:Uncharacterized protein n=1 Tax=Persea americana TaxID=3435 RepID=A0ACC2MTI5_PERAE|nr:hypothetical protein MRB53_001749 [Persea americana]